MRSPRQTALLLAVLSISIASPVLAGEFNAVINGRSVHLGASGDWNEQNYGLGVEYEFASQSRWKAIVMANGFRDSDDNMSYMAGAGLHRTIFATDRLNGFYVDAGVNAFLMTRKDVNKNRPFPGALPSLTVGNRHMGVNLTYLPRKAVEKFFDAHMMDESVRGIVFLQFKVSVSQFLADGD
ncbi:MAG: hypothetical protein QNJ07_00180 [Woeseiaceae bacterium]|nr:hypothetical protein [Woeseiaceae bacterium]